VIGAGSNEPCSQGRVTHVHTAEGEHPYGVCVRVCVSKELQLRLELGNIAKGKGETGESGSCRRIQCAEEKPTCVKPP
jgi:hypothetical protein